MIARPAAEEYAPFYGDYIDSVGKADVVRLLETQPAELRLLCEPLSEEDALARYAPGKWSVKEVVGHLSDVERVFAYRLLRISRGDRTPLAGFDDGRYVAAARFDRLPLAFLLEELGAVRASTLALVREVEPASWELTGEANGSPVSARAIVFIVAGHMRHHIGVLRERYGLGSGTAGRPG